MKRKIWWILAATFFFAGSAKADSIVAVDLEPTQFTLLDFVAQDTVTETVGVTFLWDTTTNTLSNFQVTAQGPFQGLSEIPADELFGSSGLRIVDFFDPQGAEFQLDSLIHSQLYPIPDTPGTYTSDLFFGCDGCNGDYELGVAEVTSVPEPASCLLTLVGLLGLAAIKLKRRTSASL